MSLRGAAAALLCVAATVLCSCAVGNWIVGAPSAAHAPQATRVTVTPGGSTLVARRCANCHQAPDPAAMSAEAWNAGLERMKLRMHLPAAEWDSLAAMAGRGR